MAIETALTRLLGIEHPIISAPMARVAGGRLAGAVSASGGLGLIGGGYGEAAWIAPQWEAAGNQKVGIGFITWALRQNPDLLDEALGHGPRAVMLSFDEEQPFARRIKEAGAHLICQVQSVEGAKRALGNGADVLVAQGGEAGGHGAFRATLPLVPAVADIAGGVPVVAAGGIADGRGLAAALMLGASGVLMGSRFYICEEAETPRAAFPRAAIASGDDTVKTKAFDVARGIDWPEGFAIRGLRNDWTEAWHGREAELSRSPDLEALRAGYAEAAAAGDFATAGLFTGEAVDLIKDAPAAAEIVSRVVAEAEAQLRAGAGAIV